MTLKKILLIEDEIPLANALKDFLENNNYQCVHSINGNEGLQKGLTQAYDLIVLDRMLPDLNGLEICKKLRKNKIKIPIIFLTAKSLQTDCIEGLNAGADDYLSKPFSPAELLARISAVLRRSQSTLPTIKFGANVLDYNTHKLTHNGLDQNITAKEYDLLKYFIEHKPRVISRAELLKEIWGYNATHITRTVDIHIASLRQKIEDNPSKPKILITLHSQGYYFSD